MKREGEEKTAAQGEMLRNRLLKREKHLKKWARRTGAGAYRLYDRDIPEIPLLIERWGDALTLALYKRPYEKDEGEEARWLQGMIAVVSGALDVPEERMFLKLRERRRGGLSAGSGPGRDFFRDVSEGDLLFRVNLSGHLDTGLFLDRRLFRPLVQKEAAGRRVLNLFAYTCSLSVCAAAGGALSVDSVDLSGSYLDWGRVNFALNRLKAASFSQGEYFSRAADGAALIRADVMSFLARSQAQRRKWDLIILDPPSFSNSKKTETVLDLRRDHPALVRSCLSLLERGGCLYFSAQEKKFSLEEELIRHQGAEEITESLRDEDFKRRKIPRCWRFRKG